MCVRHRLLQGLKHANVRLTVYQVGAVSVVDETDVDVSAIRQHDMLQVKVADWWRQPPVVTTCNCIATFENQQYTKIIMCYKRSTAWMHTNFNFQLLHKPENY